ncbi:hypothetical protein U1Q18_004106 [Sarracenia purpurea var. burkii]
MPEMMARWVVPWSTSEVVMDDANMGRDGQERDRIVWVGEEGCASGSVKETTSHYGFVGVVLDARIGVHRGSRHERRWRKRHGWGGVRRGRGAHAPILGIHDERAREGKKMEKAKEFLTLTNEECEIVSRVVVSPHRVGIDSSFYEDFILKGIRVEHVAPSSSYSSSSSVATARVVVGSLRARSGSPPLPKHTRSGSPHIRGRRKRWNSTHDCSRDRRRNHKTIEEHTIAPEIGDENADLVSTDGADVGAKSCADAVAVGSRRQ